MVAVSQSRVAVVLGLCFLTGGVGASAQEKPFGSGSNAEMFGEGADQTEPLVYAGGRIYMARGFGNTFLVTTAEGCVVIDTSMRMIAPRHHQLLSKVDHGPVRYVILTHGHGDHRGGVPLWMEEGTHLVAQRNYTEFLAYQKRLAPAFARRNAAQYTRTDRVEPADEARRRARRENTAAMEIEPDILVGDASTFRLGDLTFELFSTPGETYDMMTVWIPELKAAFVGDNYYTSFPNMYTLRGTKPRWALDYIDSLDKVLALGPEVVLPSHGGVIEGNAEITRVLTRYRDAIAYVHDAVVRGINEGEDVYALMREIELPPELDVPEGYGKVSWSVRGIYEGYLGWFDENPATMYATPAPAVYADLVALAGGAAAVAEKAREYLENGDPVRALHLTDVALAGEPANRSALTVRLQALQALRAAATNTNEQGWLDTGIGATRARLGE